MRGQGVPESGSSAAKSLRVGWGVGTVSRPAEGARGGVLLKKVNLLKKRNAVSLHPTQETSTGVL